MNTTQTTNTPTDPTRLDSRRALVEALDEVVPVIATAAAADPDLDTPCDRFNVGDLLAHVMAVGDRIAAMGEGLPAAAVADSIRPVEDESHVDHWAAAAARSRSTWPARGADEEVQVPWAVLSVSEAAGIYTSEVLVHAWDLAVATGQALEVPDALVGVAEAALQAQLPVEGRAEMFAQVRAQVPVSVEWSDPFGEAVPSEGTFTPIERLVALSGRSPAWRSGR